MRLLVFILFIPALIQSQGISFNKVYGNNDYDYGESIIQLNDSSYVVAGATSSFGSGNTDALLMGIDKNGNFQWQFTFGNGQIEWAQDILLHTNGDLYTVGYTNESDNNGYDILLIRTDADGTLEWLKKYGGEDWDFAYELIESNDGNVVICGETYSNTNGQNDAYAMKVNADNGGLIWEKQFGSTGHDGFFDLTEDLNGDLWFTGFTQQNDSDIYIVKTNQNGESILENIETRNFQQIGKVIETDASGDVLLAFEHWKSNQTDSIEPGYFKLDNSGSISWERSIPETTGSRIPIAIAPLQNGNFIFTSRLIETYSSSTSWLLSPSGFFISTGNPTNFGSFFFDDFEYSLITNDESPVHVGTTISWGFGNSSIWVVKQNQEFSVASDATEEYITNIEDLREDNAFLFFPNPCKSELRSTYTFPHNSEFLIYDLNGRLVHKGMVASSIPVTSLREGKYSLIISNQNRILSTFDFLKID